jgi:hypothetical protein
MIKLLMSWNIKPGREDEYFQFIVEEFGPALNELGMKVTDSWYTQYGNQPQILTGGVTQDLASMRDALSSPKWHQLREKLMGYITDYNQKVVPANGGFQL